MNKITSSLFLTLILISNAYAVSEDQLESIRQLGDLNGVALKCHYLKEARKIKLSLAASLPKERGLGEMFEDETNRSFLDFINNNKICPGEAGFHNRVQQEIERLKKRSTSVETLK
ncbi:MAG: hypothetical protein OEL79_02645 [Chromatiales bacterium]|nr:hypothetical protein [Chromatiales bacterium]